MAARETGREAASGFATALRHCCLHPSTSCVGLLAGPAPATGVVRTTDAALMSTVAVPLFHVPQSVASVRIALGCALPWLAKAGLTVTGIYASQVAAQPIERTIGQIAAALSSVGEASPAFVATLVAGEAATGLGEVVGENGWAVCRKSTLDDGCAPVFGLVPVASPPGSAHDVVCCGASRLARELHEAAESTTRLRDFDDFAEGLAPEWPSPAST